MVICECSTSNYPFIYNGKYFVFQVIKVESSLINMVWQKNKNGSHASNKFLIVL